MCEQPKIPERLLKSFLEMSFCCFRTSVKTVWCRDQFWFFWY